MDRATTAAPTLTSLPTELRSRIYAYTFCDSVVRASSTTTATITANGNSNPVSPPQTPQPGRKPTRQQSATISLRLTSKFFHTDPTLTTEFYANTTVHVTSLSDLTDFQRRFTPTQLARFRHLCIGIKWRSRPSLKQICDVERCREHHHDQPWEPLTVGVLRDVFPGLRGLSVKYHGAYVNRLRECYEYSVADLIEAVELSNRGTSEVDVFDNDDNDDDEGQVLGSTTTGLASPYANFFPTPTPTPSKPARVNLRKFHTDLARMLRHVAVGYSSCWYRGLITDATEAGVEMVFRSDLLFDAASGTGRCQVFEGVAVSNRDWTVRLRVDGVIYGFVQDVTGLVWEEQREKGRKRRRVGV